jgi:hypothetical protein
VPPPSTPKRKATSRKAPAVVFINCPFDRSYRRVFDGIVFAVMALGFVARCALERATGTQERLKKILEIIGTCQFGIHDLSFMRIDPGTRLPRYNMAFELGLFLGCCEFGGQRHAGKSCLILDRERWRYRKSLSDLSGRDIQGHRGDPKQAIIAVRNWLVTESQLDDRPGGSFIVRQYERFRKELPDLCLRAKRRVAELSFKDYCDMVAAWLRANA